MTARAAWLTHARRAHDNTRMRFIESTTDGVTLHLRCICCRASTSITEQDHRRPIVHDPACHHAARLRRMLREAGIDPKATGVVVGDM